MTPRRELILTATLVALVTGAFVLWLLARYDFNAGMFIVAGDHFVTPEALESPIPVLPDSYGYDGQFYYRLALDPFTRQADEHGIVLDQPPLRHQRILLPLLAHVFALGRAELVPWAFLIINWLSIIAVAVVAGVWCMRLGVRPFWGALAAVYPGFLFSLARDLTEPLTAALGLAALLLFHDGRRRWGVVVLALALLARETALIYAVGIATVAWVPVALALGIWVLWQGVLWQVWGHVPFLAESGHNLAVPLAGFIQSAASWTGPLSFHWGSAAFMLALVALATVAWRRTRSPGIVRYGLLAGGISVLLWSHWLWVEDITFLRAFSECYLLGLLVVLGSGQRFRIAWGVLVLASLAYIFATHFL